ncbi:SRPBCC domain-containing protein [Candidatus Uabimicrobium sp. HlEnr_7]|uniref:SRPBCC domain-containing protein n=1 Tax=Candidatus Uabimicrobium helgolandensis TaxID=3095367 RepID=UPI003557A74B
MKSVIYDSVVLPASPKKLFDMYLDAKIHGAFTGIPVESIGKESGTEFKAFDGKLQGTILQTVDSLLIVQTWRSPSFKEQDVDSTLILSFSEQNNEGRIDLVHVDVPQHDYNCIVEGWKERYWKPWRAYLEK